MSGESRRYFFMNGEKGINFNLKKNLEYLQRIYESLRSGPKLVIPNEQSNQGISNYFFHENFLVHLNICSGRHK